MAAAPKGYGDIIGSASFVLAIDTGTFNKELDNAKGKASEFHRSIEGLRFGDAISTQARSGGLGLTALAQAADDVQYGFTAIVNNIPGLAMGLGAGAGLAGSAGLAAVAINQLIKHWDDLMASFKTGSGSVLPALSERLEDMKAQLHELDAKAEELRAKRRSKDGWIFPGGLSGQEAHQLRQLEDRIKEGKKRLDDQQVIEQHGKYSSEEEQAAKQRFGRATNDLFGHSQDLIDELKQSMGAKAAKEIVADALRGDIMAQSRIMDKLPMTKQWLDFRAKASPEIAGIEKDQARANKEQDEKEKSARDAARKQEKLAEDFARANDRDAERERMKEEFGSDQGFRQMIADKEKKLEEIQDKQFADRMRQGRVYGGAREFVSAIQTSALNGDKREQLEETRKIQKDIARIREIWDRARERRQELRLEH